jgi:leucyl/phenylalanyl-tRNA--protein transferase
MRLWQFGNTPPDPELADDQGLVALGGRLTPERLLGAYRAGIFPWSSRPVVSWWSPDPRAVFELDTWRAHRSVRQAIRNHAWRFAVDEDFGGVMRACAAPAPGREGTWITADFVDAYSELHRRGHAHSVEVYEGDELVGGLYGVTVGGFFGGESMFHRRTDASKAAVAHLVERMRACGFQLLDAQVPTPHLERLGATFISRREYLRRLERAIAIDARFS